MPSLLTSVRRGSAGVQQRNAVVTAGPRLTAQTSHVTAAAAATVQRQTKMTDHVQPMTGHVYQQMFAGGRRIVFIAVPSFLDIERSCAYVPVCNILFKYKNKYHQEN